MFVQTTWFLPNTCFPAGSREFWNILSQGRPHDQPPVKTAATDEICNKHPQVTCTVTSCALCVTPQGGGSALVSPTLAPCAFSLCCLSSVSSLSRGRGCIYAYPKFLSLPQGGNRGTISEQQGARHPRVCEQLCPVSTEIPRATLPGRRGPLRRYERIQVSMLAPTMYPATSKLMRMNLPWERRGYELAEAPPAPPPRT